MKGFMENKNVRIKHETNYEILNINLIPSKKFRVKFNLIKIKSF